jgi:hypothetical protein
LSFKGSSAELSFIEVKEKLNQRNALDGWRLDRYYLNSLEKGIYDEKPIASPY